MHVTVAEEPASEAELANADQLYNLLHYWFDSVVIERLTGFIYDLPDFPPEDNLEQIRYFTARVITILGEGIKSLSKELKDDFGYLLLRRLAKIRDELAHNHRRLIGRGDDEVDACLISFLREVPSQLRAALALLHVYVQRRNAKYEALDAEQREAIVAAYFQNTSEKLHAILGQERARALINGGFTEEVLAESPADARPLLITERLRFLREKARLLTEQLAVLNTRAAAVAADTDGSVINAKIAKLRSKVASSQARVDATPSEDPKYAGMCRGLATVSEKLGVALAQAAADAASEEAVDRAEVEKELEGVNAELARRMSLSAVQNLWAAVCTARKSRSEPVRVAEDGDGGEEGAEDAGEEELEGGAAEAVAAVEESPQHSRPSRLHRLVRSWQRELETLARLRAAHVRQGGLVEGRRFLDIEYALAAIGQIFREIQDLEEQAWQELVNPTVSRIVGETIGLRNRRIMHDPWGDHTSRLLMNVGEVTLPLRKDAAALVALTGESFKKLVSNSTFQRAAYFNDLAMHAFRLGLVERAVNYFERARELFFGYGALRDMGVPDDFEVVEFYKGDEEGLANAAQRVRAASSGTLVLYEIDPKLALHRYYVLSGLSAVLAVAERYAEAQLYLEQLMNILRRSSIREVPGFTWKPVADYIWITAKTQEGSFEPQDYDELLALLRENNYLLYAVTIMNVANILDPHKRREYLALVDPQQLTLPRARFNFYASLVKSYLYLEEEKTFVMLNEMLRYLSIMHDILNDEHGEILREVGDAIREVERDFWSMMYGALMMVQNFAVESEDFRQAIDLLESAISLMQDSPFNLDWLKLNLITVQLKLCAADSDFDLTRMVGLLNEVVISANPVICAKAHMAFAFYYEHVRDGGGLFHALLAAARIKKVIPISQVENDIGEYEDFSALMCDLRDHVPDYLSRHITRVNRVIEEFCSCGNYAQAEKFQADLCVIYDCLDVPEQIGITPEVVAQGRRRLKILRARYSQRPAAMAALLRQITMRRADGDRDGERVLSPVASGEGLSMESI